MAGASRFVFVGRSPESLFDYLSGSLGETSWEERLALLNVSLRGYGSRAIDPTAPDLRPLWSHLSALDLEPTAIASSPLPVTFVDIVSGGGTLGTLTALLAARAGLAGVDPRALRRRIRFVGLTERTKNSPNTWRWQQQLEWTRAFRPAALRSVSLPYRLWTYLANFQSKASETNPPHRWGLADLRRPPRGAEQMRGLRLALAVYEHGREPGERERFASLLASRPEMRHGWMRSLVLELRGRPAR